jgi:hypothetical protein
MGILAGFALLAPLILIVLHKDTSTILLTTSLSTLLFAIHLTLFGSEVKGEKVLASVTAYEAVLVVFVGKRARSNQTSQEVSIVT